jgi:hypothetical protein
MGVFLLYNFPYYNILLPGRVFWANIRNVIFFRYTIVTIHPLQDPYNKVIIQHTLKETTMYEAIPMCVMCGDREVQIVVNSTGAGYCSPECEEPTGSWNLSDDGDALASAGFGTDEDYGYYGDE